MSDAPDLTGRDRITVERDGEELEVFNNVSVTTYHYVNSVNGHERLDHRIAKGDMGDGPPPEAVTARVARILQDEWWIDPEIDGIEVIDVTDDDVGVI